MTLRAHHVTCRYGTSPTPVLDAVSIAIPAGRTLGLTGPSGAGKTSLARILTGLQAPSSGTVTADGEPVGARRGRMAGQVGMLHQSPRLATSPRMSLAAIIAEPLAGSRAENAARARHLAERVGLTPDLLGRRPGEVSDGQLQRAALARALAAAPRYLICDEPTAMLDAATTATVAHILSALADTGVGVLAVSHDRPLLAAWADETVDVGDLAGGAEAPGR